MDSSHASLPPYTETKQPYEESKGFYLEFYIAHIGFALVKQIHVQGCSVQLFFAMLMAHTGVLCLGVVTLCWGEPAGASPTFHTAARGGLFLVVGFLLAYVCA